MTRTRTAPNLAVMPSPVLRSGAPDQHLPKRCPLHGPARFISKFQRFDLVVVRVRGGFTLCVAAINHAGRECVCFFFGGGKVRASNNDRRSVSCGLYLSSTRLPMKTPLLAVDHMCGAFSDFSFAVEGRGKCRPRFPRPFRRVGVLFVF